MVLTLPLRILGVVFAFALLIPLPAEAGVVHHALQVALTPARAELRVHDIITLPPHQGTLYFRLRPGLTVSTPDSDVRLAADPDASPEGQRYRLTLPPGRAVLTLDYRGKIDASPQQGAMGAAQTDIGFIRSDGAYLDANSLWYPRFGDELLTFVLTVTAPPDWKVVSQGPYPAKKQDRIRWEESHPQEEIYLVAAPYHEYRAAAGALNTLVYLHSDDAALANRYLSVIGDYVNMYSRLIGLYPYGKFAVVENSWESGYGMPSFTLLGPQVMRLPFIPYTSLPHEILHNWWGNGVYVDYRQGNWSEGLTAYLADHLLREQVGDGAAYRRNALLRYTNYVSEGNDFPLKDFQGRHSEATQAVGYDKALMVFHMLRLQLGDQAFVSALRHFYQHERFHRAAWDDLRRAFEDEAHHPLQDYFQQWLTRSGAPALQVREARAVRKGGGYRLSAVVSQIQGGPPFQLHVPIAVQLEGKDPAWQTMIDINQAQQTVQLDLPARPWRLAVDPEFDLFRRLDPGELPATFSEALGADRLLMVLPAAAPAAVRDGYRQLAQAWAASGTNIEIRWDKDLDQLPPQGAVWLLGWDNRFRDQVSAALSGQLSLSDSDARLAGQNFPRGDHAVVVAAHRAHNGAVMAWLGSDNAAALPGLARKLPHYGSYSYLAFQGDEPTNVLKGQWQVLDSPLNVTVAQPDDAMPPAKPLQLPPRQPLIKLK